MKEGDKVYCHTTGRFNDNSGDVFANKGKFYDVLGVKYLNGVITYIVIISEQEREHLWSNLDIFHKYFSIPITKHNIIKHKMVL